MRLRCAVAFDRRQHWTLVKLRREPGWQVGLLETRAQTPSPPPTHLPCARSLFSLLFPTQERHTLSLTPTLSLSVSRILSLPLYPPPAPTFRIHSIPLPPRGTGPVWPAGSLQLLIKTAMMIVMMIAMMIVMMIVMMTVMMIMM